MSFIDDVKRRLSNATPGPWHGDEGGPWGGQGYVVATNLPCNEANCNEWWGTDSNTNVAAYNCLLIANAPTDIAKLLELVEKYESALEQITEMSVIETKNTYGGNVAQKAARFALTDGAKIKGDVP